jgi:hypothetical protein
MLMHSLRELWTVPEGAGSIWKYLEAVVRATRVSERFAYGFQTDLHSADVTCQSIHLSECVLITVRSYQSVGLTECVLVRVCAYHSVRL